MINLYFDETLGEKYKSKTQKIRVMSENWIVQNMFCPCCGNLHIIKLKNNAPVADIKCDNCKEIFELKSTKTKIGKKINDGAYSTMMERIVSVTNPGLLVMRYSVHYEVTDLIFVPKFFFVPEIIEKRKPLSPTARRAGWMGCNILYSKIPQQGKIDIIRDRIVQSASEVVKSYTRIKRLETQNIHSRTWLFDVLDCVNHIGSNEFCLKDIYAYTEILQRRHVNNHNIEAKIRQQLQLLRDRGFIEFLGGGFYRKLL